MNNQYIQKTIKLAIDNIQQGGGPFAAVVVKNNEIVGIGANRVTMANDPTAHAEIQAIRDACSKLNTYKLDGCVIYSSCEPCPMCLSAIYWARMDKIYYALDKNDAARAGFDDSFLYNEIKKPIGEREIKMINTNREKALTVFEQWDSKADKIPY